MQKTLLTHMHTQGVKRGYISITTKMAIGIAKKKNCMENKIGKTERIF